MPQSVAKCNEMLRTARDEELLGGMKCTWCGIRSHHPCKTCLDTRNKECDDEKNKYSERYHQNPREEASLLHDDAGQQISSRKDLKKKRKEQLPTNPGKQAAPLLHNNKDKVQCEGRADQKNSSRKELKKKTKKLPECACGKWGCRRTKNEEASEDRHPGLLIRQNVFFVEDASPAIESQSETQTESQLAESQPAEIQPQLQLARQIVQSQQSEVPSAAPNPEFTQQVFGFVSEFQAKMAELPPKLSKKQTKVANTAMAKATKMHAQKVGARAKQAPAKRKGLLALKNATKYYGNPRALAILCKHGLIYKANEILPRYFACVTIYTDVKRNLWRVKPGKGRRDMVVFSRSPANWCKLVVHVKGLAWSSIETSGVYWRDGTRVYETLRF
jgi:hypothetical protein